MADDTGIDWERHYREGSTPWEKGAPHPELVSVLKGTPEVFGATDLERGRILVPGCGFGHDVRALASGFPGSRVTGIDIAPSALARAREQVEGLANAEVILQDLFAPPEPWRHHFDVVFEHTCLSALHPSLRPDYVRVIRGLLRPGGRLVAVFFINPDMEPGEKGPPFGISRAELDQLLAADFALTEKTFPIRTYPGREQREEWRVYRAV